LSGIPHPIRIEPNFAKILSKYPARNGGLSDMGLSEGIVASLRRFRTHRDTWVSRQSFNSATRILLADIERVRTRLLIGKSANEDTPEMQRDEKALAIDAVSKQVDALLSLETTDALLFRLNEYAHALRKAASDEGERGRLRDVPGEELVYELAALFIQRTKKKPGLKFRSPEEWDDASDRSFDPLKGNEFASFVREVDEAHIAACPKPNRAGPEKILPEDWKRKYGLKNIRPLVTSAVKRARAKARIKSH
jgi:hypothetical protein